MKIIPTEYTPICDNCNSYAKDCTFDIVRDDGVVAMKVCEGCLKLLHDVIHASGRNV